MGWLEGQVALVTGGGSGIGRGIVARFITEGARVGALDRVPERIEQLQAAFGEYVLPVPGDVTRLEDNKRAVEQTVRAFGQLDIFVGNAGIFDRHMSLIGLPEEKLGDAFDEQFGVNVKGCLLGAKAALPELLKTEGCMVFTASVAGFNSGGGGVLGKRAHDDGGDHPCGRRIEPPDAAPELACVHGSAVCAEPSTSRSFGKSHRGHEGGDHGDRDQGLGGCRARPDQPAHFHRASDL